MTESRGSQRVFERLDDPVPFPFRHAIDAAELFKGTARIDEEYVLAFLSLVENENGDWYLSAGKESRRQSDDARKEIVLYEIPPGFSFFLSKESPQGDDHSYSSPAITSDFYHVSDEGVVGP